MMSSDIQVLAPAAAAAISSGGIVAPGGGGMVMNSNLNNIITSSGGRMLVPTNEKRWGWGWGLLSFAACAAVGILVVKMTGDEEFPIESNSSNSSSSGRNNGNSMGVSNGGGFEQQFAREDRGGDFMNDDAYNNGNDEAMYLDLGKDSQTAADNSLLERGSSSSTAAALMRRRQQPQQTYTDSKYEDDALAIIDRVNNSFDASTSSSSFVPLWAEEMLKMTREIAKDIKDIKASLAIRDSEDDSSNNSNIKGESNSANNSEPKKEKVIVPSLEERINLVKAAVELIKKNYVSKRTVGKDELTGACQNLHLIISKLIEPTEVGGGSASIPTGSISKGSASSSYQITKIPRYHKITTTNALFRKNVVDVLDGYETLLESLGFALKNNSSSKSYEWTWALSSKDSSGDSSTCPSEQDVVAIIQECLSLLNALKDSSFNPPEIEASSSSSSSSSSNNDNNNLTVATSVLSPISAVAVAINNNDDEIIITNSSSALLSNEANLQKSVDNEVSSVSQVNLSFDDIRQAVQSDSKAPVRE